MIKITLTADKNKETKEAAEVIASALPLAIEQIKEIGLDLSPVEVVAISLSLFLDELDHALKMSEKLKKERKAGGGLDA